MRYCMNCGSVVPITRQVSNVKIAICTIVVIFCVMFGSALWVTGGIVGYGGLGASMGSIFYLVAIGLPISLYYSSSICCKLCMGRNWGVPTGWKSPNSDRF